MSVIKAATYGKGRYALMTALHDRKSFTTSGSLRGEKWDREVVDFRDTGRLPQEYRNTFMIDHMAGIDYVVWSYDTPIAWVLSDGTVKIPSVNYSVTTSRHQGLLYSL